MLNLFQHPILRISNMLGIVSYLEFVILALFNDTPIYIFFQV